MSRCFIFIFPIAADCSQNPSEPSRSVVSDGGHLCSDTLHTIERHIVSKTLIKPEVIPPFHGHIVPKPMMSTLMSDSPGDSDHSL